MIDTLGHLSNYHLIQRVEGGYDGDTLRVACTVSEQPVLARLGYRAVAVAYELALNFRLAQP